MSAAPPTIKHRLEWLLLKGLEKYLGEVSIDKASARARGLAKWGRKILKREWAWTLRNLELIYGPNLSVAQREKLAGLAFGNIFTSYLEGFHPDRGDFRNEGAEHLQIALNAGRGAILCSVHIGPWEPGLKYAASLGFPIAALYRHANNPLSEKEFVRLRAQSGLEMISRKDGWRTMRALMDKKFLGLMVDINTREGGIAAPFLGLPAMCPAGPARLALQFKAPIIPLAAVREAPGRCVLKVLPAIQPVGHKKSPEDLARLTGEVNAAFEGLIHDHAEQYNWLHARWRARPDGALWKPDDSFDAMAAERTEPFATPSARVLTLLEET